MVGQNSFAVFPDNFNHSAAEGVSVEPVDPVPGVNVVRQTLTGNVLRGWLPYRKD